MSKRDDQAEAEQDDQAEAERAKREAEGEDLRRRLARNGLTFLSFQRWREEHGNDDW